MKLRPLAARSLTLLPAVVILLAALLQARAVAAVARSRPKPTAVTLEDAPDGPWGVDRASSRARPTDRR